MPAVEIGARIWAPRGPYRQIRPCTVVACAGPEHACERAVSLSAPHVCVVFQGNRDAVCAVRVADIHADTRDRRLRAPPQPPSETVVIEIEDSASDDDEVIFVEQSTNPKSTAEQSEREPERDAAKARISSEPQTLRASREASPSTAQGPPRTANEPIHRDDLERSTSPAVLDEGLRSNRIVSTGRCQDQARGHIVDSPGPVPGGSSIHSLPVGGHVIEHFSPSHHSRSHEGSRHNAGSEHQTQWPCERPRSEGEDTRPRSEGSACEINAAADDRSLGQEGGVEISTVGRQNRDLSSTSRSPLRGPGLHSFVNTEQRGVAELRREGSAQGSHDSYARLPSPSRCLRAADVGDGSSANMLFDGREKTPRREPFGDAGSAPIQECVNPAGFSATPASSEDMFTAELPHHAVAGDGTSRGGKTSTDSTHRPGEDQASVSSSQLPPVPRRDIALVGTSGEVTSRSIAPPVPRNDATQVHLRSEPLPSANVDPPRADSRHTPTAWARAPVDECSTALAQPKQILKAMGDTQERRPCGDADVERSEKETASRSGTLSSKSVSIYEPVYQQAFKKAALPQATVHDNVRDSQAQNRDMPRAPRVFSRILPRGQASRKSIRPSQLRKLQSDSAETKKESNRKRSPSGEKEKKPAKGLASSIKSTARIDRIEPSPEIQVAGTPKNIVRQSRANLPHDRSAEASPDGSRTHRETAVGAELRTPHRAQKENDDKPRTVTQIVDVKHRGDSTAMKGGNAASTALEERHSSEPGVPSNVSPSSAEMKVTSECAQRMAELDPSALVDREAVELLARRSFDTICHAVARASAFAPMVASAGAARMQFECGCGTQRRIEGGVLQCALCRLWMHAACLTFSPDAWHALRTGQARPCCEACADRVCQQSLGMDAGLKVVVGRTTVHSSPYAMARRLSLANEHDRRLRRDLRARRRGHGGLEHELPEARPRKRRIVSRPEHVDATKLEHNLDMVLEGRYAPIAARDKYGVNALLFRARHA